MVLATRKKKAQAGAGSKKADGKQFQQGRRHVPLDPNQCACCKEMGQCKQEYPKLLKKEKKEVLMVEAREVSD